MDELVAYRIGGKDFFNHPNIYRFSELIRLKKEKLSKNTELLDFGIGEPLDMPSDSTLLSLINNSLKEKSNYYSDNGMDFFNDGVKKYMEEEYGVSLNSDEIIHCIGAKSALSILPIGFINDGDYVLSTSPGYVVLENMSKWLNGKIYHLPLKKENNFYPDFKSVDEKILRKTKILYINYPNNPTGQIANKEFYEECVRYSKKYNFIVVSDAAYLPLTYKKEDRLSFLSVDGAKDVGIEIHTLSKGFNMTGFRIGFVVGNAKIIKVFSCIKENMDSGQYIPIQHAAITALNDKKRVNDMIEKYKRRQYLLKNILSRFNLKTIDAKAGFYQYVEVPKYVNDIKIDSASYFAHFLLEKENIFTIPYDDAGSYIRFSLTFKGDSYEEDMEYLEKLYKCLKKYTFEY